MPRLSRPAAINKPHSVGSSCKPKNATLVGIRARNYFVVMTRVIGTAYFQRLYQMFKTCFYVEWFIEDNGDGTHDIEGYVQFSHNMLQATLLAALNCRSYAYPATIDEKVGTVYDARPGRFSIGVENRNLFNNNSITPTDALMMQLEPVHTIVKINSEPVKNGPCWLPQVPKAPLVKDTRRIKLFN